MFVLWPHIKIQYKFKVGRGDEFISFLVYDSRFLQMARARECAYVHKLTLSA